MSRLMLRGIFLISIIGVVGVSFYRFTSSSSDQATEVFASPSPTATQPVGTPQEGLSAPRIVDSVQVGMAEPVVSETTNQIKLSAFDFGYTGNPTVKAGEKITLTLVNTSGKATHDWVLEGAGIRTKLLNKGETDTIEFTIDKPGTYTFYCSVGNHRAQGVEGTLVVK